MAALQDHPVSSKLHKSERQQQAQESELQLQCAQVQNTHPPATESTVAGYGIWKDPDAGKDGRWEEKGTTKDEMVGWHDWLDGQTPGAGDGQRSLVCCSPWGCKELDTTEQMNLTEVYKIEILPLRLQRRRVQLAHANEKTWGCNQWRTLMCSGHGQWLGGKLKRVKTPDSHSCGNSLHHVGSLLHYEASSVFLKGYIVSWLKI